MAEPDERFGRRQMWTITTTLTGNLYDGTPIDGIDTACILP